MKPECENQTEKEIFHGGFSMALDCQRCERLTLWDLYEHNGVYLWICERCRVYGRRISEPDDRY